MCEALLMIGVHVHARVCVHTRVCEACWSLAVRRALVVGVRVFVGVKHLGVGIRLAGTWGAPSSGWHLGVEPFGCRGAHVQPSGCVCA